MMVSQVAENALDKSSSQDARQLELSAPNKWVFRIAKPEDAEVIVALVESAYRGESSKRGWTTEADLLEGQRTDLQEVREIINSDPKQSQIVLCFRATEDRGQRNLLASCHIELHPDGCHFGMYAVNPTLQNVGVGKALLAEGERRAKLLGASHMVLWVIWTRQSLIDFYLRRGYQMSLERIAFPYGDERFGLPKRDDLYFVVLRKSL